VGCAIGLPIAARGLDDLQAGVRTAATGEYVETFTYQAAMWASGDSQPVARVVDIGTGLVSVGGAAKTVAHLPRGARAATAVDDAARLVLRPI
jgi:hypothetical protein